MGQEVRLSSLMAGMTLFFQKLDQGFRSGGGMFLCAIDEVNEDISGLQRLALRGRKWKFPWHFAAFPGPRDCGPDCSSVDAGRSNAQEAGLDAFSAARRLWALRLQYCRGPQPKTRLNA